MKRAEGAFVQEMRAQLEFGYRNILRTMAGLKPIEPPHLGLVRVLYEVMEDFIYKHIDQDVNHGTYSFTRGDYIQMSPLRNDGWDFMPDRSKLREVARTEI